MDLNPIMVECGRKICLYYTVDKASVEFVCTRLQDIRSVRVSFKYQYEEKMGYTLVTPIGEPQSAEELGVHAEEMFRRGAESESKCILIDRREAGMDFDVMDIVNVSNLLEERSIQNLGVRVAVVVDASNVKVFNSLETSLTIRSFSYRIFSSEKEALNWLLSS